jgi:hypothetical protein
MSSVTQSKSRWSTKLAARLAISVALVIVGTIAGPVRSDGQTVTTPQRGYGHGWNGGNYRAPPVVYGGPSGGHAYNPPPVVYAPPQPWEQGYNDYYGYNTNGDPSKGR